MSQHSSKTSVSTDSLVSLRSGQKNALQSTCEEPSALGKLYPFWPSVILILTKSAFFVGIVAIYSSAKFHCSLC